MTLLPAGPTSNGAPPITAHDTEHDPASMDGHPLLEELQGEIITNEEAVERLKV